VRSDDEMPLLAVEELTVRYGHAVAVENISFAVKPRQILALVGANGAGKSTILKAISGMVAWHSGEIRFRGTSFAGRSRSDVVRSGVAHCPEGRRVFPYMAVIENLEIGAFTVADRRRRRERLQEVLTLFPRLAERRHQAAGTLSGGEQQMLAIGRALMSGPALLMLDEPTLGLAPIVVDQVADLLLRLGDSGLSIILVEQNADLALALSDDACVLESGRIVARGSAKELRDAPAVRSAYLGEA
jgi:branched-chain amino acid transport system ATP-binding protein